MTVIVGPWWCGRRGGRPGLPPGAASGRVASGEGCEHRKPFLGLLSGGSGAGEGNGAPRPPSLTGEVCAIDSQEVRTALSEWLPSIVSGPCEPWFLTVTFRRPPNPKYPESVLANVDRHLRAICVRPTGFLGCEPHKSGDLHVHGLIQSGEAGARRSLAWDSLFRRFGISRIEPPNGLDKVAWYCSKYITKDLAAWHIL